MDTEKQDEPNLIEASTIRSGLAELEQRSSQALQKLENVRITVNPQGSSQNSFTNASSLLGERRAPNDILKTLENIISYSDADEEDESSGFPLPQLDDVSHLALISHSIVAYLSHLDRQQLLRVTSTIASDTSGWLGSLFRFLDPSASYHTDNADAILRTVRLAIVSRCPGYLEGGIPALAHPCFYISENTTPLRLQYACRQLGIPLDAIRLIPSHSAFGTMDLSQLQKQVQSDLNSSKTPLMVIADVGASLCGFVDNLVRMHDICKAHNIWLHASGNGLAALTFSQGPGVISSSVDSIVLNLGSWLGIPSLPIVLLHRQLKNAALSAFESDPILSKRLNSLALWTSLQAMGKEAISERINVAFQTCSIVYEICMKFDGIKVLSRAPGGKTGATLNDVLNKPLEVNTLFEAVVPVVVFQFDGTRHLDEKHPSSSDGHEEIAQRIIHKSIEKRSNASYFDRLNSWLGQILQRDCPNFDFNVIEYPSHGTCVRYCPLELGLGEQPPSSVNLEAFAQSLDSHVDILMATIIHKATFNDSVEKSDVLRLVNLPDWAGMGGVQFVPEGWESILTDHAKAELNKLNIDLVEALKTTDSAFSMGEGSDGLICVRFGMVTHETDVEELLDLVVSVGKSVQENSKVLDTMSEIVKKGIEAATADLQRETEEKLWQEGLLRHVPVFGRVMNWWSPPEKESGIRGRSLNLTQGVVESTENIYRYHMQMTGVVSKLPPNKSPPTPMVQTQVVATQSAASNSITTGHSRTVSQSSGNSVAPETATSAQQL